MTNMSLTLKDWPLPYRPRLSWRVSSFLCMATAQILCKAWMRFGQRVQTKNWEILRAAVYERPPGTPLVTVCNHASCIDDPLVWGLLPMVTPSTFFLARWAPAAKDICFPTKFVSAFSARVQNVPVIRGDGVYQRAMNYCLQKLDEGKWVHIFPEGKVNLTGEYIRLKWGVSRLIAEAKTTPIVIPLWHTGMDKILPNYAPYIPRLFKKLTVTVGEPIDFTQWVANQKAAQASAVVIRKQITDTIQEKLTELKHHTEQLHNQWNITSRVARRTL